MFVYHLTSIAHETADTFSSLILKFTFISKNERDLTRAIKQLIFELTTVKKTDLLPIREFLKCINFSALSYSS